MKKQETEQRWWSALCDWMEQYQGKADCLFVYDRQEGRLERCFGRNDTLRSADADTVGELYQAASEGRFGLIRPDDMKPQLLTTDLSAYDASAGGMDMRDLERLERERKKREEELEAQNLFNWVAYTYQREQEELELRKEEEYDRYIEWLQEQESWFREWQIQRQLLTRERLEGMSRELHALDASGAKEEDCKEKIRDYLDGKSPARQPEKIAEEEQKEDCKVSGEMWGNALRHFCCFAASEVPLSIKHVKVAEHCRKILQQAKEQGLTLEDLGLYPQDRAVVRGSIEMGKLVERGLCAQTALVAGMKLPEKQYREYLRDFLAMKGVEEALAPHVRAHQAAIGTGDGPISAIQILMAHQGFSASDLREKAGRTKTLAYLAKMPQQKVTQMIRRNGSELSAMGRQVMVDSYQMGDANQNRPQAERGPESQQKDGPKR